MKRLTWALPLAAALAVPGCADTTTTTAPTAVTLTGVVVSSATVVGGTTVTGIVTLSGAAPAGGAVVTLTSSGPAATVPASLTIPAGTITLSFAIATTPVAASTTITATYAGATQTATLVTTVVAVPALQGVSLSASVAIAGVPVQGTIALTSPAPPGGLSVALTSTAAVATVPPTVVVAAGNTTQTFTVEIGASPAASAATITASYAGVIRTAALTIGQLALSVSLASIPGGLSDSAIVSLPTPAPEGGAAVALTSTSPDAVVPPVVTIPAGAMSQPFTIATVNAPPTAVATITATYGGSRQSANVTVVSYPTIVGVTCASTTPAAGTTVPCTGTLASPSPTGWRLAFATSDASVPAPANLDVPPGSLTFQFSLTTGSVPSVTAVVVRIYDADSGLSLWGVGISVSPS